MNCAEEGISACPIGLKRSFQTRPVRLCITHVAFEAESAMLLLTGAPTAGGTTGALAFARHLLKVVEASPSPSDDYVLPDGLIEDAECHFLGRSFQVFDSMLDRNSDPQVVGLSSADYWLEHGRFTGDLMAAFARGARRNEKLYRQMGRLHDLDYLKHPHNAKRSKEQVHPMPLARFLMQREVPALYCAAIMEHAGYIGAGAEFSSKLSAALSACDDLATYAAAVAPTEWRSRGEISEKALGLLGQVRPLHFRLNMDSACPTRVLAHPDRFINRAFEAAA